MCHIQEIPRGFPIIGNEDITMKKILSIALAVLMLTFALVACDKPTDTGLNYGKERLSVATQLDALNGLV